MRKVFSLFLLVMTYMIIPSAYALKCPTFNILKNNQFIKAYLSQKDARWILQSQILNYDSRQWNFFFVSPLIKGKDASEALKVGTPLFKLVIFNDDHLETQLGESMMCGYYSQFSAGTHIFAFNPPYLTGQLPI